MKHTEPMAKTAEEVAKNVASLLNYQIHLADSNYRAVIEELNDFAESFARERVKEAIDLRIKAIQDDHNRCAHNAEDIRAEALEEAAKIIQDGHRSSKCVDPNDCPYCCFANNIRALKGKL